MGIRLEQVLFVVDHEEYRWSDVMLAAKLWGDWRPFEEEVRWGLACAKGVEAEGRAIEADKIAMAASRFQADRGLDTPEVLEAWLAQWNLSAAEWVASLSRLILREASTSPSEITARYPSTDEEVRSVVGCDALCGGTLARFAQKLAVRAAIASWRHDEAAAGKLEGTPEVTSPPPIDAFRERLGDEELRVIQDQNSQNAINRLAPLEATFQRFRREVLTPAALRDQIAAHQLDWIRIDCEYLTFVTSDAAREAALCVRQDGKTIAEVSADARAPVHTQSFRLSDIDSDLRALFLSGRPGDVLGPVNWHGELRVIAVADKTMPSENDPAVRHLAEEVALARVVDHEMNRRVQWRCRF